MDQGAGVSAGCVRATRSLRVAPVAMIVAAPARLEVPTRGPSSHGIAYLALSAVSTDCFSARLNARL
jgi:hypothetical protein